MSRLTRILLCTITALTVAGCPGPKSGTGGDAPDGSMTASGPDAGANDGGFDAGQPPVDAGPSNTGDSMIGAACTGGGQDQGSCPSGEICITDGDGLPGGYCTALCSPSQPCPDGSTCVEAQPNLTLCFASCTSDSDCRQPDYVCDPQANVCVPGSLGGGGDGVTPGTNNGAACVSPVVNPGDPGTTVLGQSVNVSAALPNMQSAEVELAVDPMTHKVVIAYIEVPQNPSHVSIGVTTSLDDGATFQTPFEVPSGMTIDHNNVQSDPVVAVDSAGRFFITWIGFDETNDPNPQNMAVYVARSDDGGITFSTLTKASPPGEWDSQSSIDKPWIAVDPLDDSIMVTWMHTDANTLAIRSVRSTDHGQTWSAPINVNDSIDGQVEANLAQVTFGSDGTAYITWVEIEGQNSQFGSPGNRVMLQRIDKMGMPIGHNVAVTAGQDSPVFEDPSVAVYQGNVYVGFISGTSAGDWDVRVAASLDDGQTFQPSVKVNDDPTCATHFHHQIAVDGDGNVHAIWYDNRYLTGNVFQASSQPAATNVPLSFGPNTFVNSKAFSFTTSRSDAGWLGDYLGFQIVGHELYAAWSAPDNGGASQIWFTHGMAQ